MLFAVLKVGRKRMEDENELPGHENYTPWQKQVQYILRAYRL